MRLSVLLRPLIIFAFIATSAGCTESSRDMPTDDSGAFFSTEQTSRTLSEQPAVRRSLSGQPWQNLQRPNLVRARAGTSYVADIGDLRVKVFGPDGTFVRAIGNGDGEGPGEMLSIFDFRVEDQAVWAADMQARALHVFTRDGDYRETLQLEVAPYSMIRDGATTVVGTTFDSLLFRRVDTTGTPVNAFGSFFEGALEKPAGMDGSFVGRDGGGFLFSARRSSHLYYYDDDGTQTRVIRTIDRVPLEPAQKIERNGQIMFMPPFPPVEVTSASRDGLTLYLHARFRATDDQAARSVIDRYDIRDGRYLGSTALPRPVKNAVVENGTVHAVADTSLYVFDLPNAR